MAKPESTTTTRTVIEPHSQFDLSTHSRTTTVRSIAITTISNRTLLFIGTHSGTIFSLSPNLNDTNNPQNDTVLPNLSFLRSVSVTHTSIDTVLVLSDLGKVLILSDGSLFLVDSDLSNRAVKLGFSKGISVVTRRKMRNNESENLGLGLDTNNKKFLQKLGGLNLNSNLQSEGFSGCVLAISIGRRLMIVEIVLKDVNNASLVVLKEIQCVDGDISTMVWIDDSIIVGTANGYSLISCVSGLSSVIFSLPDVSRPPRLKLLYRDWRVLLLVDNVGIIVDEKGQPVGGSLVFRRGLDSVGELSFYVVVVSDGKVELYNKKNGGCVQVLPFGGEGIGPCVVASEEDKGGKLVAVATATKVVCYQKLPSVDQIKDLLRKKNYKGAISLVEELEYEGEMSNELLSFVHAQVGFLLLFDLHFEEAVNHFLLSETMQPSEIFPFIMRDPNRWSLLVPRNRYWGLHPPPAPLEDVVGDGLMTTKMGKNAKNMDGGAIPLPLPPLLRTLISSLFTTTAVDKTTTFLSFSVNYKLIQTLRFIILTFYLFLLRFIPSFFFIENYEHSAIKTQNNFTHDTRNDTAIGRALSQLLSALNDIPVSSRKYEVVRSLTEKIIDDNHLDGVHSLCEVNRVALSSAFGRALRQLEVKVAERDQGEGEEGDGGEWYRMVKRRVWRVVGWRVKGGEGGVPAEKLAAELVWMVKKMVECGFAAEALRRWAVADNLGFLALTADPRLQASLVKLAAFLFKEAKDFGADEIEESKMKQCMQVKLKMLQTWLPLLCRASNGTDAPALSINERAELERVLEGIIERLEQEKQEQVLSLWLHHFTHCSSTDWPNLQSCYARWCCKSRKQLLLSSEN